jgi:hypothetical protein
MALDIAARRNPLGTPFDPFDKPFDKAHGVLRTFGKLTGADATTR